MLVTQSTVCQAKFFDHNIMIVINTYVPKGGSMEPHHSFRIFHNYRGKFTGSPMRGLCFVKASKSYIIVPLRHVLGWRAIAPARRTGKINVTQDMIYFFIPFTKCQLFVVCTINIYIESHMNYKSPLDERLLLATILYSEISWNDCSNIKVY